jgi:hypothetical protein
VEDLLVEAGRLGVRAAVDQGGQQVEPLAVLVPHQVEVTQLDRPAVLDDDLGRPPHGGDPVGQLLGVGHRGRQAHQADLRGEVDDHLLPHRASVGVLEVVDLVEDDVAQAGEGGRAGVDHVAEHLGGHHHRGGVPVDRVVPGEQAHRPGAVDAGQVAELLVRERLDRAGVERLAAAVEGQLHRVLRHHRLARSRGCRHQHRPALVEGVEGPHLERIEREVVPGQQGGTGVHGVPAQAAPAAARRFWTSLPMRIDTS